MASVPSIEKMTILVNRPRAHLGNIEIEGTGVGMPGSLTNFHASFFSTTPESDFLRFPTKTTMPTLHTGVGIRWLPRRLLGVIYVDNTLILIALFHIGHARPGWPGRAGPGRARPGQDMPSHAEPCRAMLGRAWPGRARLGRPEPGQGGSGLAWPGLALA